MIIYASSFFAVSICRKKIIKGTIISFNGKCMSSQASLALNSILNYSNSSSSNSPYEERRKCYDNHHIFHLLCLLGNLRVEFIKNIYMNEFCTQNITKITPSAFDLIELLCVLKQSNIFCNHDHLKFINKQHTRTYYFSIVTPVFLSLRCFVNVSDWHPIQDCPDPSGGPACGYSWDCTSDGKPN